MKVIKKEVQVHMLPTEKESQIYSSLIDGELTYSFVVNKMSEGFKPMQRHQLYFTSNEMIKGGDWVYNSVHKTVFIASPNFMKIVSNSAFKTNRKIIASTNPKLTEKCDGCKRAKNSDTINTCNCKISRVAQPTQAFIEDYCKEGGIDKVLVEYQIIKASNRGTHWGIKVNPMDNTITIHKVDKTYTESEVNELRKSAFNSGVSVGQSSCRGVLGELEEDGFDFIKNNPL